MNGNEKETKSTQSSCVHDGWIEMATVDDMIMIIMPRKGKERMKIRNNTNQLINIDHKKGSGMH
jgi:hypothetical protein